MTSDSVGLHELLNKPNTDKGSFDSSNEKNQHTIGITMRVVATTTNSYQINGVAIEKASRSAFGKSFCAVPVIIKQLKVDEQTETEIPSIATTKFEVWRKNRCFKRNRVTLIVFIMVIAIIATISARLLLLKQLKDDVVRHEMVMRSSWGAISPQEYTDLQFPLRRVIISHTVRSQCMNFDECIKEVRTMQLYEMAADQDPDADIAVNFLVGGDGSSFEGRGYRVGAHTRPYRANFNSVCIAFIGNFNEVMPTTAQLEAAKWIIEEGIKQKKIHPDYKLYGHRQFYSTDSPGHLLYGIIKSWPHWSPLLVDVEGQYLPEGRIIEDPAVNDTVSEIEHRGIITRSTWGALVPQVYTNLQFPLKRVIISHTTRSQCMNFEECVNEVRTMQLYEIADHEDIAVNFLVGGDGNAYEGRGYRVGAHTRPYGANRNSICIAFMGNFNEAVPTTEQLEAAQRVIEEGIKQKKIHPEYKLYGHRQFYATDSPGHLLYAMIKSWTHWSPVIVDIEGILTKIQVAEDRIKEVAIGEDRIEEEGKRPHCK